VLITKNRVKVFYGPVKEYLKETIREIAKSRELVACDIEVHPDHVRMTVSAGPMESPYSIVKAFKNLTWSFLLLKHPELRSTLSNGLWSTAYYIVTVEEVSKKTIDDYVAAHSDERAMKIEV
jgi:REP element-mobilizing transposase RayT